MVVESFGLKEPKKTILSLYARPRLTDIALKAARRLQRPVVRDSRLLRLRRAPIARSQTRWRSLPLLAPRSLTDGTGAGRLLPAETPVAPSGLAGRTIALFPGCLTDNLYPEQGEAIIRALQGLGARVFIPQRLHCCGLPPLNSGDLRHGKWMARQTIAALETVSADWIVSGSASCVATVSQDYLHLFRDDSRWRGRAAAIASKVLDFTTLIDAVADLAPGSLRHASRQVIAYHDSCQGLNALGLKDAPRRILRDVLGHDVRDLSESGFCCGFGGSFSFDYPEISERLMNRKLDDVQTTGATTIVTDNQGCMLQLGGGADMQERPLTVRHIAALVAEGVEATRAANRAAGDTKQTNGDGSPAE
jgi:Fe-S oxidoreductase